MTLRVHPRPTGVDYAAIALATGYPLHEVRSRGVAFCRANPRTVEVEDDLSQLPPFEDGTNVDNPLSDVDRRLDEAFADPDLVWADGHGFSKRERAGALIIVGEHGLVPLGRRTTSAAQRQLADADDLLALVEHNLALLDIEELDEASPLSRRRQAERGVDTDKRPDPVAARARRRAWLDRLHGEALALAAEKRAVAEAEAERIEDTETTVTRQAKVRA
ncbi:hypothetical protein [Antarcticirhabdus aurantiaca]|uniref:Uncharacterized protein n=1 Tax=Antarcticirhabdus aurantiaca TaxID=2606717 RepID=A0ACD4NJC8_9HYPH|nr:hypothetical protein OXU80_18775 [Jeongeuplla avenae]